MSEHWRGGWGASSLALALVMALFGPATLAQEPTAWEPTGLAEPTRRMFTPASGAFFALTTSQLLRSNDAGATWQPLGVPVEPGQRGLRAAVDPSDHSRLYVGGAGGLYRSTDAGATWTRLDFPPPTRAAAEAVEAIAVSAADPRLVYLALTGPEGISAHFRFLRSRDAGGTWDQLDERDNSLCGWGVRLLQPHPTDSQRVFRVASCYAGRNLQDAVWQSLDQGATFAPLFEMPNLFAWRLVGGAGAQPRRYYVVANRDPRVGGGAILARSDDDGRSWAQVAAWGGPDSAMTDAVPAARAEGLAYDPEQPDRVYVGLNAAPAQTGALPPGPSRVVTSADGGPTWAALGGLGLPTIHALALGVDARNLYAATEQGVWRLRLGP